LLDGRHRIIEKENRNYDERSSEELRIMQKNIERMDRQRQLIEDEKRNL